MIVPEDVRSTGDYIANTLEGCVTKMIQILHAARKWEHAAIAWQPQKTYNILLNYTRGSPSR